MKRATLVENNLAGSCGAIAGVIALLFMADDGRGGWRSPGAIVTLMMAAAYAALGARSALLGVEVGPDSFEIHNFLRTHRVERSEVVSFELGRLRFFETPNVYARLRSGRRIRVDGLGGSRFGFFRQRERLERAVARLNED